MQPGPATRRLARQLTEAADFEGFFAANRHRFAPTTVAELKNEVDRLVKVDLTRAEPLALATRRLAVLLDDPVSLGYGEAAIAQVHHYAGRLTDAEPLYRAAIDRLRGAKLRVETAALERQLVGLYMRQGRLKEALGIARRARRTLARAGEHALLGQLENNVGTLFYYTLVRYRTALAYFDRAYAHFETAGDERSLAVVDYNRANVLLELDRPHEALELYERAERVQLAAGNAVFATQCSYMMAFALATLGRYGEALKRYYTAREQFLEIGDARSAAWTAAYLAELHIRLNVVDEAGEMATAAVAEFSSLDDHASEAARALVTSAKVLERRRQFTEAWTEVRRAQEIFDRLGMTVLGGDARLSQAELALESGDAGTAASLAAEAGQIFGRARLGGRRARARIVEATAARTLGESGRALRLARSARTAAAAANDPWIECRAEEIVGELELDRGREVDGIAALERAIAGIERLRMRLRPGEMRAAFLGDKLRSYERMIALYLGRGDADSLRSAFRYVEMAKSRALADLMAQHLSPGRPDAKRENRVREQLSRRLEDLNWYRSRIDQHDEKGGQRNKRLDAHFRSELARCERDLASLFHRLEAEDLQLAQLLAAEPANLEQLSQSLGPDEAVLEFFIASGQISAFVVTSEGLSVHPAYADLVRVQHHLTGLRFQLEKFGLGTAYARVHSSALRRSADHHLEALYASLLAPLEAELGDRKIVVIPHGILHYVPFHALKHGDGRYVVETNEISYAPSATVHSLCAERLTPTEGGMLALGISDALAPHIAEELESITQLFPGAVRLEDDRASKSAFLDLAPRSRFLHLATHGHFRQDNPMFSSVQLADGPLSFYDVFDLELNAELVTLSACNTGLNELSSGDELSGLMRGFLYAGAPSLMVSLWAVNDSSTSEMMQNFYQHLSAGVPKRAALRRTQLEALERYGHPYYWAPFILMGKA
jgi:CHAT domain-containing protein